MNYNLITVLGPTAVGKTGLAAKIAYHYNGEIISADSRQVYKGMTIGTGKDYNDYFVEGNKIEYHLIDIADPIEDYSVFNFQNDFFNAFDLINSKNKIPILCGGTNLYIHSILKDYHLNQVDFNSEECQDLMQKSLEELKDLLLAENENLHNTTDLTDKERIVKALLIKRSEKESEHKNSLNSLNICVDLPRDEIKKRITFRLKERLKNAMIEEVEFLIESGKADYKRLSYFGLEYKFIGLYLKGELNYNDMYQKLNSAIHAFAKKQSTWLRKMEREGVVLHRINGSNFEDAKKIIDAEFGK